MTSVWDEAWIPGTYPYSIERVAFDTSSNRRWHNTVLEWFMVEGPNWSHEQMGMCVLALYMILEARNQKKFLNKPPHNVVMLNTDASTLSTDDGIIGGLFHDYNGSCIGAFSKLHNLSSNLMMLKAEAIRRGMEVAIMLGFMNIIIEGDVKLVFEKLVSMDAHAFPLLSVVTIDMHFGRQKVFVFAKDLDVLQSFQPSGILDFSIDR
ncbi:uncharacterized protein G2W53_008174 [Senna tora]|uniref:RNase H type-1 domain-containing protein n=1 Tax=Senna tora TaxID=362788 RepID=A0A834X7Y7_9FABA|nr:uncharacterized protein G2W53_008174 [Senna tora]